MHRLVATALVIGGQLCAHDPLAAELDLLVVALVTAAWTLVLSMATAKERSL
jgi:hypothetical protein